MSPCACFEQATNTTQPFSGKLANKRDATLEACFNFQPWCAAKEMESTHSSNLNQHKDAQQLLLAPTEP